jgi:dUTP pyrophosphatase
MKIKLDKGAYMPTRAHNTIYSTDAGLDLYSRVTQIVPAKESAIFDTGVHIELPTITIGDKTFKTVGFLKSKSGLNVKYGITSEGGVIDLGYTGSIVVKLYNNSGYDYKVNAGDKISQLVILPILTPELELVEELESTERGEGGFGSTGKAWTPEETKEPSEIESRILGTFLGR